MKNILLLGGTGFIGRNIIDLFMSQSNINLIVISRNCKKIEKFYLSTQNIIFIESSLINFEFIVKTIFDYNVNVIIHLISSIIPSSTTQEFYNEINDVVLPTFKLIDYIADKDIKFVFFSSGGTIYGNNNDSISESAKLNPINNYGFSKLIIENYIKSKCNTTNLDYIILRPSNVYGKYQTFGSNQGFISVAIFKAYYDLPIEIWGDGNTIRDYIHVYDVVDILHKLLLSSVTKSTFNLSTGLGFSLLDIVKTIEYVVGKNLEIIFSSKRKVDATSIILKNDKLLKIINHNFIDVHAGINEQVKYFKTVVIDAE